MSRLSMKLRGRTCVSGIRGGNGDGGKVSSGRLAGDGVYGLICVGFGGLDCVSTLRAFAVRRQC